MTPSRVRGLLLLLAICAAVPAVAQEAPPAPDPSSLHRTPKQMPRVPYSSLIELSDEARADMRARARTAIEAPSTCLMLRAYIFQREDGGDAMRLVKEQTCAPSKQFQVNSAVARPLNPRP